MIERKEYDIIERVRKDLCDFFQTIRAAKDLLCLCGH